MQPAGRSLRRGVGMILILLATLPLYRLLLLGETGLAGRATVRAADVQVGLLWSSFLFVLAAGLLAGVALPREATAAPLRRAGNLLRGPSTIRIALAAGAAGSALTALFSWRVTGLRPNLIDGLVQLLHARYLAAGALAADPELWGPHWHVQNSVLTDAGWLSHFPPGHVMLLGLGFMFGAAWAVGPLLLGITAFVSVLLGDRLLPRNRALGRFGGFLVALSPFLLAHAGTFMNHATAAAFGTAALYFGIRAREGRRRWVWAAGAGAAVAVVLATRPLAGVVFAAVIAGGIWLLWPESSEADTGAGRLRATSLRSGLAILGGAPILAGLFLYNARFFGSPLRFGYHESYGASTGLGFGRDPWGNVYGPLEALAYTSADLATLNLNLLEAPVPVAVMVGVFLLLARRLRGEERVLVLWAALPVLANAFFWHHGYFMGPRMLAEFAPGWILLTTAAVAGLLPIVPDKLPGGLRFSPRTGFLGMVLAGLVGMLLLAPQRLHSYGGAWMESFPKAPPGVDGEALVFVHGSWEGRLFALLSREGVRLEVVEAALRQNPTCRVHLHALALERHGPPFGAERRPGGGEELPALDLVLRDHEHRPEVRVGAGPPIRIVEGEPLAPECEREVRADRFGVLEATALFWLGDLPGIEEGRPMYLRDLGPERNREILERYPDRAPYVYAYQGEGGTPVLREYEEGMSLLWGDDGVGPPRAGPSRVSTREHGFPSGAFALALEGRCSRRSALCPQERPAQ
jgi:hypothetical protein